MPDSSESIFDESNHRLLTREEEVFLSRLYRLTSDKELKSSIIEIFDRYNYRLVLSIALKYQRRGVELPDLIQIGRLELIRAVGTFNPDLGNKFSTHAVWWIMQKMTRAIADQGTVIRVPVHMRDRIRNMYKIQRRSEAENGRPLSPEELSKRLKVSVKQILWMMKISIPTLSLDELLGEGGDSEETLGDFVPDPKVNLQGSAEDSELKDLLEEFLTVLDDRSARILRLRNGLEDGRAYTLEEVGEKFGLTRERIRQIEGKALRRLRHPKYARRLRQYV